jgi:hypothetical protein
MTACSGRFTCASLHRCAAIQCKGAMARTREGTEKQLHRAAWNRSCPHVPLDALEANSTHIPATQQGAAPSSQKARRPGREARSDLVTTAWSIAAHAPTPSENNGLRMAFPREAITMRPAIMAAAVLMTSRAFHRCMAGAPAEDSLSVRGLLSSMALPPVWGHRSTAQGEGGEGATKRNKSRRANGLLIGLPCSMQRLARTWWIAALVGACTGSQPPVSARPAPTSVVATAAPNAVGEPREVPGTNAGDGAMGMQPRGFAGLPRLRLQDAGDLRARRSWHGGRSQDHEGDVRATQGFAVRELPGVVVAIGRLARNQRTR